MSHRPGVSERLSGYVSPTKLAENARAYPEMQQSFEGNDAIRLERVHALLRQLPLVHTNRRSVAEMRKGLHPYTHRPTNVPGHTGMLDNSIGLDTYSFLSWGAAEKSGYGRNHALFGAELLHEPGCIVTPTDINLITFTIDRPYDQLSPDSQQEIQARYFDRMVTGSDWFEITARQLLLRAKETGGKPFILNPGSLGEIKMLGGIAAGGMQDFITPDGEHTYWKQLIEQGFVPGPVDRSRISTNPYDVTAEQLGTSLDAACDAWRGVLDVKAAYASSNY